MKKRTKIEKLLDRIEDYELGKLAKEREKRSSKKDYISLEAVDELQDKELLKSIAEGRRAIRRGAKGISLKDAVKRRGIRI